jgi:hypothetical protein
MGAGESHEVDASPSASSSHNNHSNSSGSHDSGSSAPVSDKRNTCSTWSKAISSSRFDDCDDDYDHDNDKSKGKANSNNSKSDKSDKRINAIYGPIFEVADSVATIIARGVSDGLLEFVVSNGIDMFRQSVGVTADNDYVARVECRGLKASSTYTISVGGRTGTLRTPPAATTAAAVSFVFGSCIGGQGFGR